MINDADAYGESDWNGFASIEVKLSLSNIPTTIVEREMERLASLVEPHFQILFSKFLKANGFRPSEYMPQISPLFYEDEDGFLASVISLDFNAHISSNVDEQTWHRFFSLYTSDPLTDPTVELVLVAAKKVFANVSGAVLKAECTETGGG